MCKKASPLLWATAFQPFNKRSVGLVLPEMVEAPLLSHSVLHLSLVFVSCFVSGEYQSF